MNTIEKCKFCSVVKGQTPAFTVYQDQFFIAILDKKPLFSGHTLLIPKEHIQDIYQTDRPWQSDFLPIIRKISLAVETATESQGTFIAINNKVSQSIPHLHVHIVPRKKKDGLRGFFWPRKPYADEAQMEEVRMSISNYIK